MAENDKQDNNDEQSFDDLDEELELDLFDDGSDPDDQDPLADLSDTVEDDFDSEFANDLSDELDADSNDTLDEDIIDLSDDDLKQEFAALDREEPRASGADPELSPGFDTDDLGDALGDQATGNDPDDLYLNMTSEEFGAPDRYSSESGATTRVDADPQASKPAANPASTGLPAPLAALTALSPRMIVAATAAVLLPVVLFATLDFNADQSDADEPAGVSTFVDQSDNSAVSSATNNTTDTDPTGIDAPAARIAPPEPEPIQVPELPGADTPEPGSTLLAADDEPLVSADNPAAEAEQAQTFPATDLPAETAPGLLLAQADTDQTDAPATAAEQTGDRTPEQPAVQRLVASAPQDADGQPIPPEPETSAPEPVSDHSPESALTEDRSARTGSGEVAVINEAQSSGRNYHVVVASFAVEDQARQHAGRISDEEIVAYVIPPFGGSDNYRVAVAGYSSMAEARENIPGLQAVYGSGIWPLRYPPSPPLQTISERTGDTYIIVASFPAAELARNHASGLVADGEQPVIIAPYPPANRYRVAVSYFDSLNNAENALPRYRQNYGEDVWLLRY
ncbi:MAG: hypothetical protein PsegKO_14520 [Pseudohongiellaceae bacterium]